MIEAREIRNKSLAGLVQVSQLTRGIYQFEPSFPKAGNFVMPDIGEFRVKEIFANVETLISKRLLLLKMSQVIDMVGSLPCLVI